MQLTVRGKQVVIQLNDEIVVDWTEPAGFIAKHPALVRRGRQTRPRHIRPARPRRRKHRVFQKHPRETAGGEERLRG